MITAIPPIPDIPDELRLAARQGRLVPFIGAGVSLLAGCPGWGRFAALALEQVVREARLNHALLAGIASIHPSPRVRLALALQWAKKHGVTINFEHILHPSGWDRHADGNRIYDALSRLAKHFVTTNYDRWLDTFVPTAVPTVTGAAVPATTPARLTRESIYQPQHILISALDRSDIDTVVHIHGSVNDPSTMVLTTGHYIDRYAYYRGIDPSAHATTIQAFLEDLFRLKNILFVGYGLDELEILEYVILKSKRRASAGERGAQHFILQPFFSHEVDLANGIADYFENECGVTLLPFLRDHKDRAQLIDVLESFARDLAVSPLLNAERRYIMDRLLDE